MNKTVIVKVALPFKLDRVFDYIAPYNIEFGHIVAVNFGKRNCYGIVLGVTDQSSIDLKKIKHINNVLPIKLTDDFCNFIQVVSSYNIAPIGMVIKMILGSITDKPPKKPLDYMSFNNYIAPTMSAQQLQAWEEMKAMIEPEQFRVCVVDGVTGSGKTEIYLKAVAHVINNIGKSALILVPEIGLCAQMVAKFKQRFGIDPIIWHSGLTPAMRKRHWHYIINNKK